MDIRYNGLAENGHEFSQLQNHIFEQLMYPLQQPQPY